MSSLCCGGWKLLDAFVIIVGGYNMISPLSLGRSFWWWAFSRESFYVCGGGRLVFLGSGWQGGVCCSNGVCQSKASFFSSEEKCTCSVLSASSDGLVVVFGWVAADRLTGWRIWSGVVSSGWVGEGGGDGAAAPIGESGVSALLSSCSGVAVGLWAGLLVGVAAGLGCASTGPDGSACSDAGEWALLLELEWHPLRPFSSCTPSRSNPYGRECIYLWGG
ncbi:hypothetical protein V6N12_073691 [Hibiscus sabdariffa]|uniref:Uncharacterized protein n=1 Tax=Hibiscus sabdariffa TaxID=183260 RepID=A0ABR2CT70_9ROSI